MKSTAKDWDEVRAAFSTSIMVDTALSSLAQNLDAADWPIKGKTETPAVYIDLNFEEVVEMLQLKGQKPDRIDQLVSILKETLAFDSPFGDMVEQTQAAFATGASSGGSGCRNGGGGSRMATTEYILGKENKAKSCRPQ